jgi:hypothetical protein
LELSRQTKSLRYATLVLWLLWAWVVMTVTHELGHVLAGVVGGARLTELEVRPWHLPHSILVNDDYPLMTLWAGPVLGCAIPLLVASLTGRPACRFVAWFCVVANATYLLLGYFSGDGELDSTKMIRAGARPLELLGATLVALPIGYLKFRKACVELITGQDPPMTRRGLCISTAALLTVIVLQTIAGTLAISLL